MTSTYLHNRRGAKLIHATLRALLAVGVWGCVVGVGWGGLTWGGARLGGLPGAPELFGRKGECAGRRALQASKRQARIAVAQQRGQGSVRTADGFYLVAPHVPAPEPALEPDTCWVSGESIPAVVVGAFLAAEDSRFYTHRGVSVSAVGRAVYLNLLAGRVVQGGSTISQQVAKMWLGRARTFAGKVDEALLARRIEQRYSKAEILEVYLNQIFLGAGSYGVAAAARRYFSKPLAELTTAEAALLAGLTVAPSRLNPLRAPDQATRRRHTILSRMRALDLIDEAEFAEADAAPLFPLPAQSERPAVPLGQAALGPVAYAPDLVALARREAKARWPHLRFEDLEIELTLSLAQQNRARAVLADGALSLARTRGDGAHLLTTLTEEERAYYLATAPAITPPILTPGNPYAALVLSAPSADGVAEVVVGAHRLRLDMKRSPKPLALGDLVLVTPKRFVLSRFDAPADADLYPLTSIQGVFAALDLERGDVLALVGSTAPGRSPFNRALDACRPPGSVFKIVPYTLALMRGFSLASMLSDSPLHLTDAEGRPLWTPRNADRDHRGPLTLAQSFASSRNIPAIRLVMQLGTKSIVTFARHLGLRRTKLRPSLALALGSDCVQPLEMVAAYAPFARGGQALTPEVFRLVRMTRASEGLDPSGVLVERDPSLMPLAAHLSRLFSAPPEDSPQIAPMIPPGVAFLMHTLLRRVVTHGTARAADLPDTSFAGKTGTTGRFDIWFIGYSPNILAGVWLGDDHNRLPLGPKISGGDHALPIWLAWMTQLPVNPSPRAAPEPPPSITFVPIDLPTGLLAHPSGSQENLFPFLLGTQPTRTAPSATQSQAIDAERLERDF